MTERGVDSIQLPVPFFSAMADKFHEIVFTDSVRKAQAHYYGKSQRVEGAPERDALTEDETGFIQSRDSFYMATVSETGWPYVQHRGGKPGFLRVINPASVALVVGEGKRGRISAGHQPGLACLRRLQGQPP